MTRDGATVSSMLEKLLPSGRRVRGKNARTPATANCPQAEASLNQATVWDKVTAFLPEVTWYLEIGCEIDRKIGQLTDHRLLCSWSSTCELRGLW